MIAIAQTKASAVQAARAWKTPLRTGAFTAKAVPSSSRFHPPGVRRLVCSHSYLFVCERPTLPPRAGRVNRGSEPTQGRERRPGQAVDDAVELAEILDALHMHPHDAELRGAVGGGDDVLGQLLRRCPRRELPHHLGERRQRLQEEIAAELGQRLRTRLEKFAVDQADLLRV